MGISSRVGNQAAVRDPIAMVRVAVARTMPVDIVVVEPVDLVDWAGSDAAAMVVVSAVSPADWGLVRRLRAASPTIPIVVLLHQPAAIDYREAFHAGATSSVDRAAEPDVIGQVIRSARDRQALIPSGVAAAIAGGTRVDLVLSPEERSWLRQLAAGTPITDVAYQCGFSRRTMARQLRRVYLRLGAERQTAAIATAVRLGLLD